MPMKSLALAALALAVAAPVHASSANVGAEITGLKWELIDLDLTDNITPAITFTSNVLKRSLSVGYPYEEASFNTYGSGQLDYLYGGSSGSLSETALSAASWFGPSPIGQRHYHNVFSSRNMKFTLTPSTGFRFSALGSVHGQNEYADNAYASIYMSLFLQSPVGNLIRTTSLGNGYSSTDGDQDHDLSGYVASGLQGGTGEVYLSASTYAVDVSTVPEPGTYGMLLAGAAVVGMMARRRS